MLWSDCRCDMRRYFHAFATISPMPGPRDIFISVRVVSEYSYLQTADIVLCPCSAMLTPTEMSSLPSPAIAAHTCFFFFFFFFFLLRRHAALRRAPLRYSSFCQAGRYRVSIDTTLSPLLARVARCLQYVDMFRRLTGGVYYSVCVEPLRPLDIDFISVFFFFTFCRPHIATTFRVQTSSVHLRRP